MTKLTQLLITNMKKYPQIWVSRKNVSKKIALKIWEQLAGDVGLSDPIEVKRRWRNIKDQYRKELKKVVASESEIEPYVPQWKHFEELNFLRDELVDLDKARYFSWGSIPEESNSNNVASDSDESMERVVVKQHKRLNDNELSPHKPKKMKYVDPEPSTSTENIQKTDDSSKKINKIMRRLTDVEDSLNSKLSKIKSDIRIDDAGVSRNDPDYMFLISILPTIKKLTEVQKFRFRGQMNDWLLQALTDKEMTEQCETKIFLEETDRLESYDE